MYDIISSRALSILLFQNAWSMVGGVEFKEKTKDIGLNDVTWPLLRELANGYLNREEVKASLTRTVLSEMNQEDLVEKIIESWNTVREAWVTDEYLRKHYSITMHFVMFIPDVIKELVEQSL